MTVKGRKEVTYSTYLKVNELLGLQKRVTHAHDELQFIVVHQVFELWFQLLIYELESIRGAIQKDDIQGALHLFKRAHEIIKTITASFGVIETMRPYDFLEFRSKLQPASGFQSRQFREIEFMSGAKDPVYLHAFEGDPQAMTALKLRLDQPTLWDAYVQLLKKRGLPVNDEAQIVQSVIRVQKDPKLADLNGLTEAMIEYDELFALWRRRHVLMTERMIGAKPGTGKKTVDKIVREGYHSMGSGGVDYLKSTLGKKFFPLLWEARTFMER